MDHQSSSEAICEFRVQTFKNYANQSSSNLKCSSDDHNLKLLAVRNEKTIVRFCSNFKHPQCRLRDNF